MSHRNTQGQAAFSRPRSSSVSGNPSALRNGTAAVQAQIQHMYKPTNALRDKSGMQLTLAEPRKSTARSSSVRPSAQRTHQSSHKTHAEQKPLTVAQSINKVKTKPPTGSKAVFTSKKDKEMASKQASYHKLSEREKKEQDKWVDEKKKALGLCPMAFAWIRREGGYRCSGGNHFLTDGLIAEMKGGVFNVPLDLEGKWAVFWGPYYPDPLRPGRMVWGGSGVRDNGAPLGFEGQNIIWETGHPPGGALGEELRNRSMFKLQAAMRGDVAALESIGVHADSQQILGHAHGGGIFGGGRPGGGMSGAGILGSILGGGSRGQGGMPGVGIQGGSILGGSRQQPGQGSSGGAKGISMAGGGSAHPSGQKGTSGSGAKGLSIAGGESVHPSRQRGSRQQSRQVDSRQPPPSAQGQGQTSSHTSGSKHSQSGKHPSKHV
jgi:hypothetical protein